MKAYASIKEELDQRGFTLVELIVSLAILLIISVAFLTLFAGSYSNISISGRKNVLLFSAQKAVEGAISQENMEDNKYLSISFNKEVDGGPINLEVRGALFTKEIVLEDFKDRKADIAVFIPKRQE